MVNKLMEAPRQLFNSAITKIQRNNWLVWQVGQCWPIQWSRSKCININFIGFPTQSANSFLNINGFLFLATVRGSLTSESQNIWAMYVNNANKREESVRQWRRMCAMWREKGSNHVQHVCFYEARGDVPLGTATWQRFGPHRRGREKSFTPPPCLTQPTVHADTIGPQRARLASRQGALEELQRAQLEFSVVRRRIRRRIKFWIQEKDNPDKSMQSLLLRLSTKLQFWE